MPGKRKTKRKVKKESKDSIYAKQLLSLKKARDVLAKKRAARKRAAKKRRR